MKTFKERLVEMNACPAAVEWVGERTLKQAWAECERGDWMLWFAAKMDVDIRTLTKAKVSTARLVQHLMEDERSLKALDVAESFAEGRATRQELDAAVAAADAAAAAYAAAAVAAADAAAADSAAAAVAAYAAAIDAAYAAAAYAAAAAADAADADAADADAADAYAKKELLKKSAEICRDIIPFEMIIEKLEEFTEEIPNGK